LKFRGIEPTQTISAMAREKGCVAKNLRRMLRAKSHVPVQLR
jgi:hypothetical protein